eukprot:CAMPEP_0174981358 /NCGR_PEP_ID=MMETSP0004_2-20121128/15844_1 /TAXON_ID=420556 /ORGANISM="Ochromonas sp., Strain CCMP1393" /LENGTH=197 /DNA_ID=CAMNT_0016233091 /DNA_START=79 /DNA_END=672 /DNA_ORIENTATION=-
MFILFMSLAVTVYPLVILHQNTNCAYRSTSLAQSKENNTNRQSSGGKHKTSSDRRKYSDSKWKSDYIVSNKRQNYTRRRNDPWWMRDEEKNNPRIFPPYAPKWLEKGNIVDDKWKAADLRAEAEKKGLDSKGLKADLIDRINASANKYSLSDDNFTAPEFIPVPAAELCSCFPEVYEGGDQQMCSLRDKIRQMSSKK